MLLPKGMSAKTVREKLPPWRGVVGLLARTRFWFVVILTIIAITVYRSFGDSAKNMQKYVSSLPSSLPPGLPPHPPECCRADRKMN